MPPPFPRPGPANEIGDDAGVSVNDEEIRFLEKDYRFKDGDEATLVPSIAGG